MNEEALRCLLCAKPGCSLACPVRTPVPVCMKLYIDGRIDEAGEILFRNNPLSAITALICDWELTCMGHCVLNRRNMPVRWHEIEYEISWEYLRRKHMVRSAGDKGRISVVGAGPAGIAAAIWLAGNGCEVHVYDDNPRIGGVLRYGIPPFRLDRKYVDEYERLFDEAGIRFHGNVSVGKDTGLDELESSSDAVLLAAGACRPAKLGIPGEDLPSVVSALDFLKNPSSFTLGRKVIVAGGGNVAMDACRTAMRMGADTWVYYRKTFENMPAGRAEVQEAIDEGVRFSTFKAPVEIRDGAVVFRDCENVTDPETGRISTHILDGTDREVACDTFIVAISERADLSVFGGRMPELDGHGYPVTDGDGRIPSTRIFEAGDFLTGPRSVVAAVAGARKAVDAILDGAAKD